jgi:mRNA interferase MazF
MYLNGEIWKVKLYPIRGSEQDGIRPCLIVSPDSMNKSLSTLIVLPMTTQLRDWPSRVEINFDNKIGQACVEHIRSVSKERFIEKLGTASDIEMSIVQKHLQATFSA